jgi:hypothetical protein
MTSHHRIKSGDWMRNVLELLFVKTRRLQTHRQFHRAEMTPCTSNAAFVIVDEIPEREEGTSDREEKVELAVAGKNIAPMWWLSEKETTCLSPSALSFSALLE